MDFTAHLRERSMEMPAKRPTRKSSSKRPAAKKAAPKRPVAKAAAKKSAPKRSAVKKTAAPKKALKKTVSKRAAAPKKAIKKALTKKKPTVARSTVLKVTQPPAKTGTRSITGSKKGGATGPTEFSPYAVKKNEDYMSEAQKGHFRGILNHWKAQLMNEVDTTVSHMKEEADSFADPLDRASQEEGFSL